MRRSCVRRTVLGLGVALLALRPAAARAQDAAPVAPAPGAPAKPAPPPPTPEQAADAVLAVVAAKDDAALKALAAKDDPDPWLVADELIRRGEFDTADAFAGAAPRVDTEKLPAYVASRRGKADDPVRRERLVASIAASQARKPADALEAIGPEEPGPIEDVVGVRLAMGRGFALRSLVRLDVSATAFLAAGEAAEKFGWLARASRAFEGSAMSAWEGSAFAAARGAWEQRLSITERRGAQAEAARTLGHIGLVHRALGDFAKALSILGRALAAQEALGDKVGAARALGNIGVVHFGLGDYAKALSIYERASAAQDALGDYEGAAATLGNIGAVHAALGDSAKALAIYERALAAKEAVADHPGAALTLSNIGAVHARLGDSAKALSIYERVLAARVALGDQVGAATTLGNIGSAYSRLGDAAKALSSFERALAAKEALGDKAGTAHALVNVGRAHHRLGDPAKAIKFLERAARAAEKLGANPLLVAALHSIAGVRLRSGDAGRSMESAHKAVWLLKTIVGGLGEEQGATARAQYTGVFSTGLAAAARVDDAAEAAFFLESGRAGTMLESLDARDTLRHAALPEPLRIAEAQARAVESRAQAAYVKAQDGDDLAVIRAADAALQAARATTAEVYERIQREAKREARLWYPVATPVEDIQGFLAPEEALVLYGLAEKDEPAHALVLTRGEARIVALGASAAIVAACEALEANDASVDPTAAFERLRTLLIAPLGLAKGTKRLLVSPEGPLSYVPFMALVPDREVAYEPSGTTYGVLLEEKDKRGTQVLALGDPDYTAKFDPTALDVYAPLARATPGATRGGRLVPLPGTRVEATAIGSVTLLGKDASESGLRAALAKHKERWRGVHFACHGLVNPDRPTLSSLALTPDGDHDGFLTVLEVLRTEIPADLVVLSACETGKGKIVGGEGIVGLTRAFMYAGSPRVLCSLWKVDDAATSALMTKFYELWNPRAGSAGAGTLSEPGSAPGESKGPNVGRPGLPTAEALRQAQAFVKSQEKWKHPYYWAAWVLWGLPN